MKLNTAESIIRKLDSRMIKMYSLLKTNFDMFQRNHVSTDISFHTRKTGRLESQLNYRQEEGTFMVETDASRLESLSGLCSELLIYY